MRSFTFDTNCLIALEKHEPAAVHLRALIDAARSGRAEVAFTAATASEALRDGAGHPSSAAPFKARLDALDMSDIPVLHTQAVWGVSHWGAARWTGKEARAREVLIMRTAFPNYRHDWTSHAQMIGADPADEFSKGYKDWRNKLLDAQGFRAHEEAGRDIFVTSDKRLCIKITASKDFPDAMMLKPDDAAALL